MLNASADFKLAVYAPEREFRSRATITLLGETNAYEDDRVVRMNILEEMSTLNDSVPSNELLLTLTNEDGAFDLLNFQNMHEILASKPVIETELGLLLHQEKEQQTIMSNFIGAKYNSTVENPNTYLYKYATALPSPTTFTALATQTHIDRLAAKDNSTSLLTTTTNGYIPYALFRFNIIDILTRRFGEAIWLGETDLDAKILLAEKYCYKITAFWTGYGVSAIGNEAYLRMSSGTTSYFGTTRSHTAAVPTTMNIATFSVASAIGSAGNVDIAAYSGASNGTIAAELRTDFVELEIITNPFDAVEWKKTGKFFLTEWKNEITNKIISMVGRDYFTNFSEISYEPQGITNLKDLAVSVLTAGGVPVADQIIDDSLAAITVRPFPERIDCRTALQHIGIAGGVAVGQDRDGKVFLKPFKILDEASNYITYPTTQPSLYGYVGGSMYPINDTGGGMRYLDFEQMYNEPIVALEKSIYQLVIKVYSDTPDVEPTEMVYINAFIQGTNGLSFTIDNPLINSAEIAEKVAEWYMREINYNAIYQVNWRQNPTLECADMVLIEDSFGAEKQTRIIRQEFQYEGYLSGVTESRGGI